MVAASQFVAVTRPSRSVLSCSSVMYSTNINNLSNMARAANTSIFVKNGPSYNGIGMGGEGWTSWTIASPTGEGLTTCRTFTRERRCVIKDSFRIV